MKKITIENNGLKIVLFKYGNKFACFIGSDLKAMTDRRFTVDKEFTIYLLTCTAGQTEHIILVYQQL